MNRKSEDIQAMIEAVQAEDAKVPLFLSAWKDAIKLAGTEYFGITSDSVESASELNQLRPDIPLIFDSLGGLSTHERTFMLCLCQFYCDSDTRALCNEKGIAMPSLADIACMGDKHLDPVFRLLANYTGW